MKPAAALSGDKGAVAEFRANPRRHMIRGTIRVFLGEALVLPTGLITAAFLTRQFAPHGYGLFAVAATLIAWVEWSVAAIFGRATFKLIGEASDWRPVGSAVVRLYGAVGLTVAVLLWLVSDAIAAALKEPSLGGYLRLFAIDIPIFAVAQAHRNILIGIGNFGGRAAVSAVRWISRLLLIVMLVAGGLSIPGAILGSIGASLSELVTSRFYVQPALFGKARLAMRQLWMLALPLLGYAVSMRLMDKLDLIMLQGLRGNATEAGIYGAAQNLTVIGGLLAGAFAPLLQSTITRLLQDAQPQLARRTGFDAIRGVIGMLPFAAIISGSAAEVCGAVFGNAFRAAGVPLSLLIFGSVCFAAIGVATAILIAFGRIGTTVGLTAPLVGLAVVAQVVLIRLLGVVGAALATTLVASIGGLAAVVVLNRVAGLPIPTATFARSA
jgi:O-antigen/teichoic acid export membrane protein